jgi:hypothetical protein
VGAVRRLFEPGVKPGLIAGTSVGAINAAKIAEGENRGTTANPSGLAGLESVWLSLSSDSDMYVPNPDFDISAVQQAAGSGGVDVITNLVGGVLGFVFGPGVLPVMAIFDLAQTAPDLQRLQAAVDTLLNCRSLFLLTPIGAKLAAQLDPGLVKSSGIRLLLSSVSLEDGVLRFVNELGEVPLADGAMASASIPVVFTPTKLGDQNYVDGGVRAPVPVAAAVASGASRGRPDLGEDRYLRVARATRAKRPVKSSQMAASRHEKVLTGRCLQHGPLADQQDDYCTDPRGQAGSRWRGRGPRRETPSIRA